MDNGDLSHFHKIIFKNKCLQTNIALISNQMKSVDKDRHSLYTGSGIQICNSSNFLFNTTPPKKKKKKKSKIAKSTTTDRTMLETRIRASRNQNPDLKNNNKPS
ncbi:hypothetical protein Dimus_031856 [Dionaea muscipula]